MTDPQIAIQLHYLANAIGYAGYWIAFAIILAAGLRALFNK